VVVASAGRGEGRAKRVGVALRDAAHSKVTVAVMVTCVLAVVVLRVGVVRHGRGGLGLGLGLGLRVGVRSVGVRRVRVGVRDVGRWDGRLHVHGSRLDGGVREGGARQLQLRLWLLLDGAGTRLVGLCGVVSKGKAK
jgi:hypothetical protein